MLLCVAFGAACGGDDDDKPSFAGSGGFGGFFPGGSGGSAPGGSGGSAPVGTAGTTSGSGGSTSGSGGSAGSTPAKPMCPSAGCPSGQFCVSDKCVDKCDADAQCGTAEKCCDGGCIDITTDRANCGACGTACDETERCVDSACTALMCMLDFDGGVALDVNGCPDNERCVEKSGDGACMCGDGPSCPAPETCNADGACRCNDAAGCASSDTCCGDGCKDLKNDEANCGKCGKQCASGATCNAGVCECDKAGYGDCDGTCVALNTATNCGVCGTACEAPSTCRDPSGSRPLGCYCPNVNEVPCDGACVALGTVDNCGGCGDSCNAPETACSNGKCQCPNANETACGNTCVNLANGIDTDTSGNTLIKNCGACGVTCMANAACTNGKCACPGAPTTDVYCDENRTTGATDGNFACIVPDTTKNCGDCGVACIDDSECRTAANANGPEDFSCVCIGADAGKTHCAGSGCVDPRTDEQNCGVCGRQCPKDISCTNSQCQCPAAAPDLCVVDGEPKCIDFDSDEQHCGACGTVCGNGFECCGGSCVNIDTYDNSNTNCGSCGNTCNGFLCGIINCCSNGSCN